MQKRLEEWRKKVVSPPNLTKVIQKNFVARKGNQGDIIEDKNNQNTWR